MIKPLLKIAAPIILAQLFQIAYQFTDAFWVGRLGEKAVAAVAMSLPILFFMTSLGIGLAIAGSTLTAQHFGAQNKKMVSQAAAQTMLMVIFVSAIFSFIGYIFAGDILQLLGADASILKDSSAYLRISFLGLIFNFCFFVFQSIMRSIGRPQTPFYIIIGTVALNFILDPVFMFGAGPLPALGVAGVALATLGTQSLAALIGLSILFTGKHGIHLNLKDFQPNFYFLKRSFLLGLPASIEQSARSLSLTVVTALIAKFGTLAVAAYGVGSNILQLMLMISFGLAGANAALVGQNLGANRPDQAKKVAFLSAKIAFLVFSLLGLISFIWADQFINFFVPGNQAVISAGARYLHFIAPMFGFIGLQIIIGSTLQAAGSTTKAMTLTLISQWLVQIPLIYCLSRFSNLGLDGLWLAFPITNILMAGVYFSVFRYSGWEKKKLISDQNKLKEQIQEGAEIETAIPL